MLNLDVEDTIWASNCDFKSAKRGTAGWHLSEISAREG